MSEGIASVVATELPAPVCLGVTLERLTLDPEARALMDQVAADIERALTMGLFHPARTGNGDVSVEEPGEEEDVAAETEGEEDDFPDSEEEEEWEDAAPAPRIRFDPSEVEWDETELARAYEEAERIIRKRDPLDPVRMYLEQAGIIPFLTRSQEIALGAEIHASRNRWRRAILESPAVQCRALDLLRRICERQAAIGRTLEDADMKREREKTLQSMRATLPDVEECVRRNQLIAAFLASSPPQDARDHALRMLQRNAHRARELLERAPLRTIWLKELAKELQQMLCAFERKGRENGEGEEEETHDPLTLYRAGEPHEALRSRLERMRGHASQWEQAKKKLADGNLRLVISIAKKYRNRGLSFLDLIQDGNVGLMIACDKYQYWRGFKFCTYATWWIRQAITRAIADQSRVMRIPLYATGLLDEIRAYTKRVAQEREGEVPGEEEIAQALGIDVPTVQRLLRSMFMGSLDWSATKDSDSLGTFQVDHRHTAPDREADLRLLREAIDAVLEHASPREASLVRQLFGLFRGTGEEGTDDLYDDNSLYGIHLTLEEVGESREVTRERVRQIIDKLEIKLKDKNYPGFRILRAYAGFDSRTGRALPERRGTGAPVAMAQILEDDVRLLNFLQRKGIFYDTDLCRWTADALLAIPNFGGESLKKLAAALAQAGIFHPELNPMKREGGEEESRGKAARSA